MADKKNILYILSNNSSSEYWKDTLRKATMPWGRVIDSDATNALKKINKTNFDLIIIDTEDIYDDIEFLIAQIRQKTESSHLVIASDVCTWRRARRAFHLSASDYLQKTLKHKELQKDLLRVLSSPLPKCYSNKET